MRKVLLFATAVVVLVAPLVYAASFSDDFNRSDSVDLGTNWDSGYSGFGSLEIVGNRIRATNFDNNAIESVNAISAANDQFAQLEIAFISGIGTGELNSFVITRAAAPNTSTWYQCESMKFREGGMTTRLAKTIAGEGTELSSNTTTTWSSGDVIKLTSSGTTHKCFQNTTELLSTTDGAIASGRVGSGLAVTSGGSNDLTSIEGDNFQGGDLAGAPSTRARMRLIQW